MSEVLLLAPAFLSSRGEQQVRTLVSTIGCSLLLLVSLPGTYDAVWLYDLGLRFMRLSAFTWNSFVMVEEIQQNFRSTEKVSSFVLWESYPSYTKSSDPI
jgi:hypothetical protein